MPKKPCLDCGQLFTIGTSFIRGDKRKRAARCPRCQEQADGRRDLSDPAVRRQRKAAVDAWVQAHGWVCPGWRRDPHPSTDLTADHVVAVASGGNPLGPFAVLCRSCNSRKGSTP